MWQHKICIMLVRKKKKWMKPKNEKKRNLFSLFLNSSWRAFVLSMFSFKMSPFIIWSLSSISLQFSGFPFLLFCLPLSSSRSSSGSSQSTDMDVNILDLRSSHHNVRVRVNVSCRGCHGRQSQINFQSHGWVSHSVLHWPALLANGWALLIDSLQ